MATLSTAGIRVYLGSIFLRTQESEAGTDIVAHLGIARKIVQNSSLGNWKPDNPRRPRSARFIKLISHSIYPPQRETTPAALQRTAAAKTTLRAPARNPDPPSYRAAAVSKRDLSNGFRGAHHVVRRRRGIFGNIAAIRSQLLSVLGLSVRLRSRMEDRKKGGACMDVVVLDASPMRRQ